MITKNKVCECLKCILNGVHRFMVHKLYALLYTSCVAVIRLYCLGLGCLMQHNERLGFSLSFTQEISKPNCQNILSINISMVNILHKTHRKKCFSGGCMGDQFLSN